MARVPEAELERLKREVDLAELVRRSGVALSRRGEDLVGLCPFHDDTEPSLVVSPKRHLWHCLGACQAGGSVIDWVMRSEGVSFRQAVELTEAERREALELLGSEDLVGRILEDFARCGVVGEETNKLVGYLVAVSRKLDRPLAAILQSSSAAGKTSLMEAVLALVPPEERVGYSAMTGQSLFYMGEKDLRHKVLSIVEEEGAERASYALKLLQSEGELSIASTGKDPRSGRLVTHEYRVEGPVAILLTTTAIDLDEELQNRSIVLSVDEARGQTRAIHRLQRERRTLEGLLARREREAILRRHRNAQRLLEPLAVVNPYAPELTFLDTRTRTRRDHEKYLTLIDAVALLHQHQREIRVVEGSAGPEGRELRYVEVELADVELANRLAHEVLGRSLDELPPQTRRFLTALDGLVEGWAAEQGIERSDVRFRARAVREALDLGATQAKLHLRRLVELEYVIVHATGHGVGWLYELLYRGEGRDGRPFLPGLIDVETLRGRETRGYDRGRSGSREGRSAPEAGRSGSGRPPVGPRSGGGRRGAGRSAAPRGKGFARRSRPGSRDRHLPGRWAMSRRRPGQEAPADPMGLAALVEDYLAHLASAHYSPHTVRNRRSHLRQFCRWCEARGIARPVEVTRPVLERYRQWLFHYRRDDGRALSWATQGHKLVAVKMYLKWLARSNVLLYNPASELELPRRPRRLPVAVLTLAEVERVLAQPDVRDPLGVRDRAILETLYSTGMRRMEIVGLALYDVDVERGTVLIRLGKGAKDRMVPIGERALAWIERYLAQVRPALVVPPDDGHLFLSRRGRPFTLKGMTRLCHRRVQAAGVTKAGSCHIFRHTCATLMLERGADIRFIQEMLGHEHLATTAVYTRVSIGKLKQMHEATHPSAQLGRRGASPAAGEDEGDEPTAEDVLDALEAEADEEDGWVG